MSEHMNEAHQIDDRALARQAQSGDQQAFTQLVETCSERLYNMLYQFCNGDAEMASELTQEAFVRAYERLAQFDGKSAFYTWLYRLARNRAIDVMKRKKPIANDPHTMHDPGKQQNVAQAIEQDEVQRLVQTGLQLLNADQREIILMRDFDELDYAQIAEHLSIAEGTVKSRLNRARKALRTQIETLQNSENITGLLS